MGRWDIALNDELISKKFNLQLGWLGFIKIVQHKNQHAFIFIEIIQLF